MNALLSAAPPTIGRPLPELQQVDFGSATMGWLDFAAPALLGLLVQRRVVAGVATGLAAGLWALLLLATSPIAATPPVLVGLIAGRKPPRSTATVETTQGRVGGRRARRPRSVQAQQTMVAWAAASASDDRPDEKREQCSERPFREGAPADQPDARFVRRRRTELRVDDTPW
jgi:hypothetical protein